MLALLDWVRSLHGLAMSLLRSLMERLGLWPLPWYLNLAHSLVFPVLFELKYDPEVCRQAKIKIVITNLEGENIRWVMLHSY